MVGLLGVAVWLLPPAGAPAADRCLVRWEVAGAPAGLRVSCRDGDPRCDADGAVNGACTVGVRLCLNAAGCAPGVLDRVELPGAVDPGLASAVGALTLPVAGVDTCSTSMPVGLVRGRVPVTLRARVRDSTAGRASRARVTLRCVGGPRPGGRAVVVTTDFETGQLAAVGVRRPHAVAHPGVGVHADAVIRTLGDRVVVVNRFLGDSIVVLDRRLRPRLECSTDPGSDPHDIVAAGPRKAYVTRFNRTRLMVVDPAASSCDRFRCGAIDLSAFADADGLPEMDQMALVGNRLFVSLERLDRDRQFAPAGRSWLVAIDTTTDTVAGEPIRLSGANAFSASSGLAVEPGTGKLLVAEAGDIYRTGDGGIERVDPASGVAEGFFVTEEALGGSITDFVIVSPEVGWAIVLDERLVNHLVTFDPSTGQRTQHVLARQAFLPRLALAPDGTIWLADRGLPEPGIRIFDAATGRQHTRRAIDVGLPPFTMVFLP